MCFSDLAREDALSRDLNRSIFPVDVTLLGHTLASDDEPGDTFEDRVRANLGYVWIDAHEGYADEDFADIEEGYDMPVWFWTSEAELDKLIATIRSEIENEVRHPYSCWQPSDEFILEMIESQTEMADIMRAARAEYKASHEPYEFNPSDEEPEVPEDDDAIRVSACGIVTKKVRNKTERIEHNNRFHFGAWKSRCRESNHRRKTKRTKPASRESIRYAKVRADMYPVVDWDDGRVYQHRFIGLVAEVRPAR